MLLAKTETELRLKLVHVTWRPVAILYSWPCATRKVVVFGRFVMFG